MAEFDAIRVAVARRRCPCASPVARCASLTVISISLPTPPRSSCWNGFVGRMTLFRVFHEELGFGVVTAHAEGGLRQVVGAKAVELGILGQFVGGERRTESRSWSRTLKSTVVPLSAKTLGRHTVDDFLHVLQFVGMTGQRHHDLGWTSTPSLLDVNRRLEDGPHLHLGDLRHDDAQAIATQAEHGLASLSALTRFRISSFAAPGPAPCRSRSAW